MKKISAFCIILVVILLSGCTYKKIEITNATAVPTSPGLPPINTNISGRITFETLDIGNSITAEMEKPEIIVAGNAAEAARFAGLLAEGDAATRIQKTDFNNTVMVAVFRGQMSTSGYGITVQEISLAPGMVKLTVNLTDPAPDQAVLPVISYPYHIILLKKEELNLAPGTIWAVHTPDDTLLAQTRYP